MLTGVKWDSEGATPGVSDPRPPSDRWEANTSMASTLCASRGGLSPGFDPGGVAALARSSTWEGTEADPVSWPAKWKVGDSRLVILDQELCSNGPGCRLEAAEDATLHMV